MPANILNLSSLVVDSVDETEHDYHIHAHALSSPTSCPGCGSNEVVGFGRNEQLVKDLPIHGKRVGIYFDTRRFMCKTCNKTFLEKHADFHPERAMTNRLVSWIGKQSIKRTFASLAEETGVVEGTIRNIFSDYVNELQQSVCFETPKWMGIDEIHLIRPRGVITNIADNTIVELLPNRNKDTVARYLTNLPDKDKIRYVAMDMWAPYRDACAAVIPHAKIVIDKFHVVRMANDAMEKARKALREELTPKQKRGLMHDRFVLLKRESALNDKERLLLDGWTRNYPKLGQAYRLKERFYGIYENSASPEEAMMNYGAWYRDVTPDIREPFNDLIRAWTNWQPWILEYFNHPITNAYTESLNNLIRVMTRLGRGYSFEALRAKILFAEGAHKRTHTRPKFERNVASPRRNDMQGRVAFAGYGTPEMLFDEIEMPRAPKPISMKNAPPEKNYGVDISTLIRLLEEGQL